jgi:uncharacterized membrane protein
MWSRFVLVGWFIWISFGVIGCPGFGDSDPPGAVEMVPENPTWEDAEIVLDLYCNECHGSTPTRGAPGNFRLDSCANVGSALGAQSQGARIKVRSTGPSSSMPPGSYEKQPTANDRELLRRWVDQGAMCP